MADQQYKAALDVWKQACASIADSMGVGAAEDLVDDLQAALADVVRDLSPMVPTTMTGVAAKARAAIALDPHGDNSFNDWEDELRSVILRDVVLIGGGA